MKFSPKAFLLLEVFFRNNLNDTSLLLKINTTTTSDFHFLDIREKDQNFSNFLRIRYLFVFIFFRDNVTFTTFGSGIFGILNLTFDFFLINPQ